MKHYIIVFAFIFLGVQHLQAQDVYDIGTYSGPFSFTDVQNTNLYTDHNGNGMPDVMYKVTISSTMNLSISTCNSQMASTRITVINVTGGNVDITNQWVQDTGACPNSDQASLLHNNLMQGIYYFIVEGTNTNGYVYTTITGTASTGGQIGDTMNNPIDVGTQDPGFGYCDTQNTAVSFNDNYGQPSNDVYYRFTLSQAMTVKLFHCGSGVSNTYIHLLNASGTLISENNDYSGVGQCSNIQQAYLKQELQAGTYYVVSEGAGDANGSITTWIQGVKTSSSEKGVLEGSSTQNYIFSITPTVASNAGNPLTTDESLQTIQYFDGLGRPTQTVQAYITPDGADLVSGIEYDGFGRDYRHWLPGAATGNGGAYVSDFGAKATSTNGGDTKPYTETIFESSPLNRPLGQHQPGADWYAHPTGIDYLTNDGDVKYFYVEGTQLKYSSNYTSSTLYRQKTTDEDGKTVEEFTDKQGRKVLSRAAGNHDTYYVYDDLNNLRYVLPPLAADAMGASQTAISESAGSPLYNYGYIYHYDGRKRCTEKKLPGCDWIYMVYDKADRMILSQDGNQRLKSTKEWTVTKYDVFGRMLYTGLMNSNDSRATMESNYSGAVTSETYTGSGPVAGFTSGNLTPTTLLTVNYYDNYSFISNSALNYDSSQEQNGYTAQHSTAKGLLTGTRVYHLNDPNASETTALYYDKYGRVVQTRATNHLGGYDLVYNQLDFTGKPIRTYKTHGINGTTPSITEVYTYGYNKAQQPTTTTYSLNGGGAITLVANAYDELGRLKTKKLGGIETTTYSYNVRSWPTNNTSGSFQENLYYNSNLPSGVTPNYNGNIALSSWTYNGAVKKYGYSYDGLNRLTASTLYDANNQSNTTFAESFTFDKMGNVTNLGRTGSSTQIDGLTLTYNGNQLKQVDDAGGSRNQYDIKEYTNRNTSGDDFAYDDNGNMVKDLDRNIVAIQYNVLNLPDIIQFKNGNQIKNTYNAGGQKLGTEYFTQLTNITPLADGQVINQSYNSGVVDQDGNGYIGNMEYKTQNGNSSLTAISRIYNDEGYVETPANPQYYYYRRDHLGDNREVWLANTGETVQRTQYYPSGLPWAYNSGDNPGKQQRKYNGKEFVEMHGYDTYDIVWRQYYPAIMRFQTPDPEIENDYNLSPYTMCSDNMVNRIDPDGRVDGNPDALSVTGNFAKGLGQSLWGTVTGVAGMIMHPVNTVKSIASAVVHPINTGNSIANSVTSGYADFKNGNANIKANIAGKVVGDVAQLFVGAGEVKAGVNAIKGAKVAEEVAVGAKVAKTSASLGAGRIGVKQWLQNAGNLERGKLIQNIESAGFKSMSKPTSPVSVFERGGMRIRLDPPQGKTLYNHMHLEYGGNSYNHMLNPVHYKSPEAHIPIK